MVIFLIYTLHLPSHVPYYIYTQPSLTTSLFHCSFWFPTSTRTVLPRKHRVMPRQTFMNEPLPGGRAILGVEWHGMTPEIVESVDVEEDAFVVFPQIKFIKFSKDSSNDLLMYWEGNKNFHKFLVQNPAFSVPKPTSNWLGQTVPTRRRYSQETMRNPSAAKAWRKGPSAAQCEKWLVNLPHPGLRSGVWLEVTVTIVIVSWFISPIYGTYNLLI